MKKNINITQLYIKIYDFQINLKDPNKITFEDT